MASFGYERERGQKPAPGAAEPEARHRAEEGELWPSLSLSPETPSGEPGAERSNYFGADAWKPSSSLWYFDGESHPPGDPLPTEVTLTADTHPAGHFDWSVVEGGEKVEVGDGREPGRATGRDDNRVQVRSTEASAGEDDVRIRMAHYGDDGALVTAGEGNLGVRTPAGTRSAGAVTSAPAAYPVGEEGAAEEEVPQVEEPRTEETATALPESAPKSLSHKPRDDNDHATWGYETHENYEVLDDAGSPIKGFQVNELFTTAPTNDAAKCDWRRGKAGGTTSKGTTFFDNMQGELSDKTPTPQKPQTPRGATKVQHWSQEWYIGSTTPGKGTKVQTNTFQKYQDHAEHENIKSPP